MQSKNLRQPSHICHIRRMPICQPGFCDQWPLQRKSTLARTDKFSEKTFRTDKFLKVLILSTEIQLFMLSFFDSLNSLFNEPVRWDGLGEFVDTVRESAPWPGCGLMACCTLAVAMLAMLAMLAWFNPKIPEFKANAPHVQHNYCIYGSWVSRVSTMSSRREQVHMTLQPTGLDLVRLRRLASKFELQAEKYDLKVSCVWELVQHTEPPRFQSSSGTIQEVQWLSCQCYCVSLQAHA